MEMYADYLKELRGMGLVVSDKGFANYQITGSECYIRDVYVKPEFRKSGEAAKLADQITEIAKSKGCTHLTGTVDPNLEGATQRVQVLIAYGMRIFRSFEDRIVFYKEIKDE